MDQKATSAPNAGRDICIETISGTELAERQQHFLRYLALIIRRNSWHTLESKVGLAPNVEARAQLKNLSRLLIQSER
jgi:hypothetical protein